MSRPLRIKKMSLYNALSRYYATTSVHKRGHQQEFYRVCVIQRHPVAQKMMDEITTVDIAAYRDFRLSQINVRTGRKPPHLHWRVHRPVMSRTGKPQSHGHSGKSRPVTDFSNVSGTSVPALRCRLFRTSARYLTR